MPQFTGIKVTQDANAAASYSDLNKVEVDLDTHTICTAKLLHLGSGHGSGFQAINLAVQFGAKRIALVGFDMRLDKGVHWHGRHGERLSNPSDQLIRLWIGKLEAAAKPLAMLGVDVVNLSQDSALKAFRKATPEQIEIEWQLQPAQSDLSRSSGAALSAKG